LIEACSLGKPVIMGPSTYNFADAVRLARDAGALVQVDDAVEAMRTAHRLLQDENSRARMSEAGHRLVDENRGATEKTLVLIAAALEKNHGG
jgi:3-deoxy-D-manno-octulosonic-acid transferase